MVLTQPAERPGDKIAMLWRAVNARGMRCNVLPIASYSVLGAAFMQAWRRLSATFGRVFASGACVGVCRHHGAGRIGAVAAMHLIDAGYETETALRLLRRQFPETVGADHQHGWLTRYALGL